MGSPAPGALDLLVVTISDSSHSKGAEEQILQGKKPAVIVNDDGAVVEEAPEEAEATASEKKGALFLSVAKRRMQH